MVLWRGVPIVDAKWWQMERRLNKILVVKITTQNVAQDRTILLYCFPRPIILLVARSCNTQKVGKKWMEQFEADVSWLTDKRFTWKECTHRTFLTYKLFDRWADPILVILAWEPFGKETWEVIGGEVLHVNKVAIWFVAPLSMIQFIELKFCKVDDKQKGVEILG